MSEQNKQLVSFVLDSGVALPAEKLEALTKGFARLLAQENSLVEWELLCLDGFCPKVVKSFEEGALAPVHVGGLPLISRALESAAARLTSRAAELQSEHLPWLILLSAGFSLDDPAPAISALEESKTVVYLPFKLSPMLHTEGMRAADRVKHMITIKEDGIDGFFAFFEGLLARRAQAGGEGGLKFRKNDFEGWGEL